MKTLLRKAILIPVLCSLLGCGILGGDDRAGAHHVRSDKARETSPDVPASDRTELVRGNNAFAFELYRQLREGQDGNLFFSPYSISLALAMTYAGARGETERQMAETLHFTLPQNRLHPAFNELDLELQSRGEGEEGFRLHIANALWGQQDYEFLAEFLDIIAENYGAGLNLVDFVRDAEAARAAINEWVEEQTEGKIKDLIPPGVLDTLTRLVLVNAIYFNAAWDEPFNPALTTDGPFYLLDGRRVVVPMMRNTTFYSYGSGDGYQAIALPYEGGALSMLLVMPAEGEFAAFEDALDADRVDAILDNLSLQRVTLTMPRFEFESEFNLGNTLAAMGMPDAFSDAADLSGMTGNRDLRIQAVIHKAFVAVDEEGTEAAAATAAVIGLTAAPIEEPVEFTLDHPFIFLIYDAETGTILFAGRVMNPAN